MDGPSPDSRVGESLSAQLPSYGPKRPGSLRARILVAMVLLALVPLIIMAYQGYHCARQAIVDAAHAHIHSVANARLQRINAWLEERKHDIALLRDMLFSSCESLTSDRARRMTLTYHRNRPMYKSVLLFDAKSTRQARRKIASHAISDAFWDSLDASPQVHFSPSHFHDEKNLVLHVGLRALTPQGDTAGYLVAIVDLKEPLQRILQDGTGLGQTGKSYLLSTKGKYLVPPRGAENLTGAMIQPDHLAGQSRLTAEYLDYRGVPVIGRRVQVPGLDGVVVCEMDQSEGFSWLRSLQFRAVITGLAVLLVALVIALWSAEKLARPFQRLGAVARRVGEGHHRERLHGMETIEAQDVAKAFNRMLDRIESEHEKVVRTASLAAIGELSSSVVHEMRNPLSSIKLNLSALRERVKDDPDYVELANIAGEQAARLERMFSDLLSYGKPLQLTTSVFPPLDLLKQATEFCRPEAERQDVELDVAWHGPADMPMQADRELMLRVLTNLLLNAVHVSPSGSTVVLRAAVPGDDDGAFEIAVADAGPGIPQDMRERVFEPFFTTREGGTGLGLANVKKIVEHHGGTVRIADRPEGGAVFILRLPGAVV